MQQDNLLPFNGGGSTPVQYFVDYNSTEYYVRYRGGGLQVYSNVVQFSDEEILFEAQLGDTYDGDWNARETNVYLTVLSQAIQTGKFNIDDFPPKNIIRTHRYYKLGALPIYPVGLICGNYESSPPSENKMNRHDRHKRKLRGIHDHDNHCYAYVAAQDTATWITRHQTEHDAFRKFFSIMWKSVARDLEIDP
jgi:hypothetical protein